MMVCLARLSRQVLLFLSWFEVLLEELIGTPPTLLFSSLIKESLVTVSNHKNIIVDYDPLLLLTKISLS